MNEIFWRAFIGAAVLGAVAGPIGCFILWRRMAYLGASLAHMALLGAAIGLLAGISPPLGVLAVSLVAAFLLARPGRLFSGFYRAADTVPADTMIGLVGHAGLALGFVVLASLETVRADLLGYLFGDVLALGDRDVATICIAGAGALLLLRGLWHKLLADTINPEILAAEDGVAAGARVQGLFLALVAGLIAFGLQIVGALLIVALLIIPPACARPFARTPEAMAVLAGIFGAAAAPLGLAGAFATDIPAGPAIVLAATALFLATQGISRLFLR
jgi:zinc transport system permease protein